MSGFLEIPVLYFEKPGAENTDLVIERARKRALELGIRDVVVASVSGRTAKRVRDVFGEGYNIVCITHHAGFEKPGELEIDPNLREELERLGVKVHAATHALSGVERSISRRFGGLGPVEIIAETLRLFGEGVKVCVEISVMAADAGLIPVDRDIIAIGGTGEGADTALVLRPANMNRFFEIEIREIIAKPRRRW